MTSTDLMRFTQFVSVIYAPRYSSRLQTKIRARIGKRFGPWLVLDYAGTRERKAGRLALWTAQCTCGAIKTVTTNQLLKQSSCGHIRRQLRGERCHKKLTNRKVKLIKLMLRDGFSQREMLENLT